MNLELVIGILSLLVSAVSAGYVWIQIVAAAKTTRAELLNNLVGVVHSDVTSQKILELVYRNALTFERGQPSDHGSVAIVATPDSENVTDSVEQLLNRLQIVGHLQYIGVLRRADLRGMRYEIIMIGRSSAIRDFFCFLNTDYQGMSGVIHDHFRFFKKLYLEFEYDRRYIDSFQNCLFELPEQIKE